MTRRGREWQWNVNGYIVGALWCAMFGDERVVPRAEIVSLNY